MIGAKKSIADRVHWVTFQAPGAAVSDGDGDTTQQWFPLTPPSLFAAIEIPSARDLERLAAGTVISTKLRTLTCSFHPQVTTATRVLWTDPAGRQHLASITGVDNPDGRCIETVCLCVELETAVPLVLEESWMETGDWVEA